MTYSHAELTSSVIEAAMEVQRALGGGFAKDVFRRALVAELGREGVEASINPAVPLYYKGDEVGERRVDISVEGVVCVELNIEAHYHLPDLESAMQHLRAAGMDAGLLLNFGPCKLDYVRMHVQGCRSDILIGDSIQHQPERKTFSSSNGHGRKNGAALGRGVRRWMPVWLRGKRLQ